MQTVNTIYSLIPPIITLLLAIISKRVIFSLLVGIVCGGLMIQQLDLLATGEYLLESVAHLFWEDGLNQGNVFLILFLFILGIISAFVSISGGVRAFAHWATPYIKTRRGAQLFASFLGVFIFIDDYFNCLTNGSISRPLTDSRKVSRAKLAYIIDATAAPVCVMTPISSWGAYIIGIMTSIFAMHSINHISPIAGFLQLIPMHYYALFAVLMVFAVARYNLNFGPMKVHEARALRGKLFDEVHGRVVGEDTDLHTFRTGQVKDMLLPILCLVISTIIAFVWIGQHQLMQQGDTFTLVKALEHTDSQLALLLGGSVSLLFCLLWFYYRRLPIKAVRKSIHFGVKSMLPAIYILLFAWLMVGVVSDLETGTYLAGLINNVIPAAYLPVLVFLVSGFMAFATGTSWGTFSIMLPLSAQIAMVIEPSLLLPLFAAVLSGAVAGDHCSPISDTTILAATGARSHPIDHFLTQLPYGLLIFTLAAFGYLLLGLLHSAWLSLLITSCVFVLMIYLFNLLKR
jgi:tetracycline resistance efflux pump